MATQDPYSKIDLIGFNLKMLAKGHKRSLLISAGAQEDKQFLLQKYEVEDVRILLEMAGESLEQET